MRNVRTKPRWPSISAKRRPPLGGVRRTVSYLRQAAQRALSVGDSDAAWNLFHRASTLLESEKASPSLRCEFLVEAGEVGEVGVRGPESDRVRGVLADAIVIARDLDDGELFCRAALAQSYHSVTASEFDASVVALLEEGLDRLGEGPQALRSQVLARLAREIFYQPGGLARALELTDQAIAHAKRSQDARTLASVLEDVTFVRWSGADPVGWLELNQQIVRSATRAGDADLRFRGVKGLPRPTSR